eukprot:4116946-Prymnesium_polylepis.1
MELEALLRAEAEAAATGSARSRAPDELLCAPPPPKVTAVSDSQAVHIDDQAAAPTAAADTTRSA